jgi:hypothetical protein
MIDRLGHEANYGQIILDAMKLGYLKLDDAKALNGAREIETTGKRPSKKGAALEKLVAKCRQIEKETREKSETETALDLAIIASQCGDIWMTVKPSDLDKEPTAPALEQKVNETNPWRLARRAIVGKADPEVIAEFKTREEAREELAKQNDPEWIYMIQWNGAPDAAPKVDAPAAPAKAAPKKEKKAAPVKAAPAPAAPVVAAAPAPPAPAPVPANVVTIQPPECHCAACYYSKHKILPLLLVPDHNAPADPDDVGLYLEKEDIEALSPELKAELKKALLAACKRQTEKKARKA